jgi:hypothetical protein
MSAFGSGILVYFPGSLLCSILHPTCPIESNYSEYSTEEIIADLKHGTIFYCIPVTCTAHCTLVFETPRPIYRAVGWAVYYIRGSTTNCYVHSDTSTMQGIALLLLSGASFYFIHKLLSFINALQAIQYVKHPMIKQFYLVV